MADKGKGKMLPHRTDPDPESEEIQLLCEEIQREMERYRPEPDSVKRKRTDLDPDLDSDGENLLLTENRPEPDGKGKMLPHRIDPDPESEEIQLLCEEIQREMERYRPEPDSVKRKHTDLDLDLDSDGENLLLTENRPEPDGKRLHQNDPEDSDSDTDTKNSETIFQNLASLRNLSGFGSETLLTLADLSLDSLYLEVSYLPPEIIKSKIEDIAVQVEESKGIRGMSRSSKFQVYIPELDRLVLKKNTAILGKRKTEMTSSIITIIDELCSKEMHTTKRDIFYHNVELFKKQEDSDSVLDDICCMMGCTRCSLFVLADERGVVVGRLKFEENGDMVDCSKMGIGGKAIPPHNVGSMRSDALFVLLVEKHATFLRLAEDKFYNRFPCIIITGKGYPDVATRMFLQRLRMELHLPVLALMDSDPHGVKILSVYGCGSKSMSYDSLNLTTPNIRWLGIRPTDFEKYKIPEKCLLSLTKNDIKIGENLLKEDFIKSKPEWVEELQLMLKLKKKAEIQALSSFGFQYLTEKYLPKKLLYQDWL